MRRNWSPTHDFPWVVSGYGRELSDLGIREFVHANTVWVG